MKKLSIVIVLTLSLILTGTLYAAEGLPWKSHEAPFDFLFGNHFDTHQQSMLIGNNQLNGFFYIKYTGKDIDGVPEATHADCDTVPEECLAGWKLKGIAIQATLIEKPEMSHPIWCVDPKDMPRQPGFSHFHWLGMPEHAGHLQVGDTYDGYLLKLTARDTFYFQHHGGFLVTPGIDTETHANVISCSD